MTLVIVADGDIGLNIPDYRAAEKTFQLLVQAAGRAGRGQKGGKVIIQTRNPDHYCWHYIKSYDYEGFYKEEMQRREKLQYPPFVKLGLLRFSCSLANDNAEKRIKDVGGEIRARLKGVTLKILGPAPAPIGYLRGRKRFQCLLKGSSWPEMREVYFHASAILGRDFDIRVSLDLDPVNML